MSSILLAPILLLTFGALQLVIAALLGWRQGVKDWGMRLLIAYAVVAGLWEIALAIGRFGWVAFLAGELLAQVSAYVIIVLALIFILLNRAAWRMLPAGRSWPWWLVAAIGLVSLLVLQLGLIPGLAALPFGLPALSLGVAILAWIIPVGGAVYLTLRAYRAAAQSLHRGRVLYWLLVLVTLIAADSLFFLGRDDLSSVFRFASFLLAAYILTAQRLLDLQQLSRRLLAYLSVILLAAILYAGGVLGFSYLFQNTLRYEPWVALVLAGASLALLLHPLVQLNQRWIYRSLLSRGYDARRAVDDYSASISNILDIERLTAKVTSLISETIHARRASLFLVDHVSVETGGSAYRLRAVKLKDQADLPEGNLSAANPVATRLGGEGHSLAQYDIDFLPQYRDLPAAERAWLSQLSMEVYVPIHTRGQWLGLLTVGPKTNGQHYFDADLALLETLASQTGIALENARLVANLYQLNKNLKIAYTDLEKTHHQLNELDRLKSEFIGAITHELRTPVANIQFSIQLIEKFGIQHMLPEQQEQMYQLITATKYAKIMVDNLVNFATFIGKQGDLKLSQFNFSDLLLETLTMLEPHARRKNVVLQTETAPGGLPLLTGDRPRLGDAAYHLIQNAIKFTNAEGVVSIRCWAENGSLHFEVKDTGVGVPPDKLPFLWEGFNQMADPEKRGVEGLGLGLALVKYTVDAHTGKVYAESRPGKGSTFGFRLPLAGPNPPPPPAPQDEPEAVV